MQRIKICVIPKSV